MSGKIINAESRFPSSLERRKNRARGREKFRSEILPSIVARLSSRGSAYTAKRRAAKLRATPSWANAAAIKTIYEEAKRLSILTGIPHHVDHIIPLQGSLVCGLHVENNLQILTASENSRKKNRFDT